MYKVQRLYIETQEASDLGTYATLDEAKDRLVLVIEDAYERERGLDVGSVSKCTDEAWRKGYHYFREDDGTVSSWFTIQSDI